MEDAELYSRSSQLQRREAEAFLEHCAGAGLLRFGREERVLDLGCGPGDVTTRVLLPLLPQDATLVGVDVSAGMVGHAAAHHASRRVSFRRADVEGAGLAALLGPRRFHKIFSFHCLHWIKNQSLAFENMKELLKPGGSLLVVFIADSRMNDLDDILVRRSKWNKFLTGLERRSPRLNVEGDVQQFYRDLLTRLNFEITENKSIQSNFTFRDMQHLCDLVKALHPAVRAMSAEETEEFVSDTERTVLSHGLADVDPATGRLTASHRVHWIVATKPRHQPDTTLPSLQQQPLHQ